MYREKNSIHKAQYYPKFWASTGGPGMYPSRLKKGYCIQQILVIAVLMLYKVVPNIEVANSVWFLPDSGHTCQPINT